MSATEALSNVEAHLARVRAGPQLQTARTPVTFTAAPVARDPADGPGTLGWVRGIAGEFRTPGHPGPAMLAPGCANMTQGALARGDVPFFDAAGVVIGVVREFGGYDALACGGEVFDTPEGRAVRDRLTDDRGLRGLRGPRPALVCRLGFTSHRQHAEPFGGALRTIPVHDQIELMAIWLVELLPPVTV